MAKRRRHTTALQKANEALEAEGRRQCALKYSATGLALRRFWGKKKDAIGRLMEVTRETWKECASTNMHSMIEMCEKEAGVEIQNGNGKSWHDLPYMNATLDTNRMSPAKWAYMRQRQKQWVAPQVMACVMVALHRKYGFGAERLSRIYGQVQELEAEFDMDPEKIKAACLEETGVDVSRFYITDGDPEPEKSK